MANAKSLGPGSGMNARPIKSFNQRPSVSVSTGHQNIRQVNSSQPRPASNPTVRQMNPVQNNTGRVVPPEPKVTGGTRPAPQVATSNQTQTTNPVSNFVEVMRKMVGSFAILSDDVINQNLELAVGHGMTIDDRTISFECADYLISNLAFIFMGLVLDNNFKSAFMDSLMVELQIDNQPEDVKKKTRESMKNKKAYNSNGSIVLGLTTFMPNIGAELMNKMNKSFELLDSFADEFDAEVAKLTTKQKVEYGFIFSNFMYLIRAFTHNDMFMSYVITVIEKVKDITSEKK